MKTYRLTVIMLVAVFMVFSALPASSITITKLGKGGAVIQPNGSYKLCPQFAFKKCCKITLTFKDLWNWITDEGCWEDDVNTNMPLRGEAVVYDENGLPSGQFSVDIIWINPSSCASINGEDITMEHPDIHLEVVQ
jgi:hypothetical protein